VYFFIYSSAHIMYKNIFFLLVSTGLISMSCNDNRTTETVNKPEVPVVSITSSLLELDRLYVADIQAVRNVEIRSKISGFLETRYVDEGQTVRKGQVMFKIADAEYRAELTQAKAALKSVKAEARITEVEYERTKLMVDKKILSKSELELSLSKFNAAKAKIDEAESAVDQAEHRLSYTVLCAPFDGVVDRIPLKSGSLVNEGVLITTVSDISTMHAYFNISENEYLAFNKTHDSAAIAENRVVGLLLSDGQMYNHNGKIETVVSEFNESTGSISIRASFPNPEALLKHNATGKIKLTSDKVQSLLLPQKAAFEIQDKHYVYLLGQDNVLKMKSFEPSGRYGQYYIVKSGLKQGDRIVYEGIQNLKEGMKIIPRMLASDSLSALAGRL
jgi:membrane fusion protein (multidrug efflux system)